MSFLPSPLPSPHNHMFMPEEIILVKLYVALGKNHKVNLEFNSLFQYYGPIEVIWPYFVSISSSMKWGYY